MAGFETLYGQLSLDYSEEAHKVIESYSSSANPTETDAGVGSEEILKRNSVSNIWNWKRRLTTSEIERIRCGVEDVSRVFYSDEDW